MGWRFGHPIQRIALIFLTWKSLLYPFTAAGKKRVNDASIGERKHLLPEDTLYICIEGGDYHQFGSCEINPDDHLATTSRASQHEQIIQATLEIFQTVSELVDSGKYFGKDLRDFLPDRPKSAGIWANLGSLN